MTPLYFNWSTRIDLEQNSKWWTDYDHWELEPEENMPPEVKESGWYKMDQSVVYLFVLDEGSKTVGTIYTFNKGILEAMRHAVGLPIF